MCIDPTNFRCPICLTPEATLENVTRPEDGSDLPGHYRCTRISSHRFVPVLALIEGENPDPYDPTRCRLFPLTTMD